jgi:hypothetical protein
MRVEGKELICEQCEIMPEKRRAYLKGGIPKIKQVKLRIMLMEPINEFLQPGGTYKKYIWKMKQHQMHVKLLGSKFGVRMCYHYFQDNDGVVVAEMDYSERYQPIPMHEIQSENFGKDADVSMEIRIVSFQDTNMSQRIVSYSHLSNEKPQIAATTFQNTIDMLNNFKERGEVIDDNYNMIIYITDGCAGQYKCGTALYLLAMQAQKTGKVMYHFVKCAGHGKCRCDAEGGCHKTFCDTAFDKLVTVPKRQMEGNRWAPSHRVKGGSIVSLASTEFNILQDDDYIRGARSHSCWKKKEEQRIISERRFILRQPGSANFLPLKMEAVGFNKGKNMGLHAHHNFVADPEVLGYTVMARRIPCLCQGCSSRFKKPIEQRYSNPCNDCKYWRIYLGWNDWRTIVFRKGKDCKVNELLVAQQWTLHKISARTAEQIVPGKFGAYLVDDVIKYYLVRWTTVPWIVRDGPLDTDGGVAREGEWVCKGLWLNDVPCALSWFYVGEKEVVVRCQIVLCPNFDMQEHSAMNDLPRMNANHRTTVLLLNPICLSEEYHNVLMDSTSLREGLDYEEEIPDSASESSKSDEEMDDKEDDDGENSETEDEQ